MKPVFALALVFIAFGRLCAQTPQDLARDVKANMFSVTALRNVIEKHAANEDTVHKWVYHSDTIGFFQQKKFFHHFQYRVPSGAKDGITRHVHLHVTYTGDKVRHIKMYAFHYKYRDIPHGETWPIYNADTAYTDSLLSTYNTTYKTNFTFADLYEDDCKDFCVIARNQFEGQYKRPDGSIATVYYSYEFGDFWLMIRDRDHAAIVKNCRSFNTNRKAYGAFCLYVLQRQGEPLSWEEKELMQQILNSTDKVNHRAACKSSDGVPIKDLLTPQELKELYSYLYSGK